MDCVSLTDIGGRFLIALVALWLFNQAWDGAARIIHDTRRLVRWLRRRHA